MGVRLSDWTVAFRADARGAGATRARALTTFKALAAHAKTACWGDVTPASITTKQVFGYVKSRVAAGITPRVIQNEVSNIRRCVRSAGGDVGNLKDVKNGWSCGRLGVPKGSRIGNKSATDLIKYADARQNLDLRMRAVADLALQLGLRRQEAVKASNTSEWIAVIKTALAEHRACDLHVTEDAGAKGGRPRFIFVPECRLIETLAVIENVQSLKDFRGFVLEYDTLQKALKHYDNQMRCVGLVGTDSGHGLRRAFAVQQYAYYIASGLSSDDSLKRLARDLGHGDERGRWIQNNYLKGV
jgi:integrase